MDKVEIRPIADAEDRNAAFAVREAVFVDEQMIGLALEFDGLDDEAEHLLATLDGRIVGTLRLRRIDQATAKIERVAVLKDARGRKVGSRLVEAALTHLRAQGFEQAKLHAQTYALDFYSRLGLTAYGDVFDEDGIAHKAMRVDLAGDGAATPPLARPFVRTVEVRKG